jgi:hypothetical protein
MHELSEPMERSDDPWSLILASPGMFGGKGNMIEIRKKVFKMRKEAAAEISRAVTEALIEYFGRNDVTNGYRRDQL